MTSGLKIRLLEMRIALLRIALRAVTGSADADDHAAAEHVLARDAEMEAEMGWAEESSAAPQTAPGSASGAKRAARRKPRPHPEAVAQAGAAPGKPVHPVLGPTQQRIIAALTREPMTSGELIKRLGFPSGAVYSSLSILRQRGLVETFVDEADGQRKNRVREAANAA